MDKVHVYLDDAGGWRWHRKAPNGETISQGEAHTSKRDAQRAVERVNHQGWTYAPGSERDDDREVDTP